MNTVLTPLFAAILGAALHWPEPAHAQATSGDRDAVQAAYVSNDLAEAERLLAPLLAANPDDPDLLRRKAALAAARNDLRLAQEAIDRASALAPRDPDIQISRARILLWRNELAAAREIASAVAADYPNYQGLDELELALRKASEARALRLISLGLGGSVSDVSFQSGSQQTWYVQRGSLAAQWDDGNVAAFEIEREQRQQTDTHVAVRFDVPLGRGRYFVSVTATPRPDFRETWSIGAGADLKLKENLTAQIDGRFAEYVRDDVATVGAGLRAQVTSRFALSARTIHLFGGGENYRLGGSLRAEYSHPRIGDAFAIVARYPDVEDDGARQLTSVAGGVRFPLGERLTLALTTEYESRASSYERTSFILDLRWRFGEL